jgi:hypothetical protein
LGDFEIGGAEELLLQQSERSHSLKVVSETSFILYMNNKQFTSLVLNGIPHIRHFMCQLLKSQ